MIIVPQVSPSKQTSCSASSSAAVVRFLAIAMFVVGVGMLIGMWTMNERAQRMQAWPTTTGRVLETRVEKRSGDDNKKYRSIIRYSYFVDGAALESERYSFGSNRRTKDAAEALCAKYPVGSEVQVYYDPARPAQAVLVLDPAGKATPLGIAGILLMAAGGFVLTLSFRIVPSMTTAPAST